MHMFPNVTVIYCLSELLLLLENLDTHCLSVDIMLRISHAKYLNIYDYHFR